MKKIKLFVALTLIALAGTTAATTKKNTVDWTYYYVDFFQQCQAIVLPPTGCNHFDVDPCTIWIDGEGNCPLYSWRSAFGDCEQPLKRL